MEAADDRFVRHLRQRRAAVNAARRRLCPGCGAGWRSRHGVCLACGHECQEPPPRLCDILANEAGGWPHAGLVKAVVRAVSDAALDHRGGPLEQQVAFWAWFGERGLHKPAPEDHDEVE